jgi:hypothetical protein
MSKCTSTAYTAEQLLPVFCVIIRKFRFAYAKHGSCLKVEVHFNRLFMVHLIIVILDSELLVNKQYAF